MDRAHDTRAPYVPLLWRLFVPNAVVLASACAALWIQPANGRIAALGAGLVVLLIVNWVLMRRTFTPLARLIDVAEEVDPLEPGRRIDASGQRSEVAVLERSFNAMLERLEDERRDSARRAATAQQEERRRISRELHDEIGQSLTAHSFHLDRIAAQAPQLQADISAAREDALGILDDVRRLAETVRPDVLDNLGLVSALVEMLERFGERTGIVVEREFSARLPALEDDVELTVYRVAQEAVTNVARHAGATTVRVSLQPDGDGVLLRVVDDGGGIDAGALMASRGGLRGMRERAVAVGARVGVECAPDRGTAVTLRAPGRAGGS